MKHLTCDTWNVTCDMWHDSHGGGWTFSQNFSSPALTVWDRQCLEDFEQKDDSMNEWINEWTNHKGVYRTAPTTPGLLIIILPVNLTITISGGKLCDISSVQTKWNGQLCEVRSMVNY